MSDWVGLFLIGVVPLLAFGLGRVCAILLGRTEGFFHARARYLLALSPAVWLLGSVLVVEWLSPGATLDGVEKHPLIRSGIDVFATVALAAVTRAGLWRGLKSLFEPQYDGGQYPSGSARRRRWLLSLTGAGAVALLVETLTVGSISVPSRWLVPIVLALIVGVCYPLIQTFGVPLYPLVLPYRWASESQQRRIERCYERFGREPGHVVVVGSQPRNPSPIAVAGGGVFKTVLVSEPFLERVDDDALAVMLAEADEKHTTAFVRLMLAVQTVGALLFVASIYALLGWVPTASTQGGRLAAFVIGVLSVYVSLGIAMRFLRRRVYAVDRFVSSQFGPERVTETYRRFDEELSLFADAPLAATRGLLGRFVVPEPTVRSRIDRLSTGDETKQTTPAGGGFVWTALAENVRDRRLWILSPLVSFFTLVFVPVLLTEALGIPQESGGILHLVVYLGPLVAYFVTVPVVSVLAPLGVYFERREPSTDFSPWIGLYLTVLPMVNALVSLSYLLQWYRHTECSIFGTLPMANFR